MRIIAKMAKEMIGVLEEIKEEIFPEDEASYPYAEWERKREKVKQRLRDLPVSVRVTSFVNTTDFTFHHFQVVHPQMALQ